MSRRLQTLTVHKGPAATKLRATLRPAYPFLSLRSEEGACADLLVTMVDEESLGRAVRSFLRSDRVDAIGMHVAISHLSARWPVAIVGGMLRDLALGGSGAFRSDMDVAIDGVSAETLEAFLRQRKWLTGRTSWGGFRLQVLHAKVDLFLLREAWWVKEGHVDARSFADWSKMPMLCWDAAGYEVRTQKLHTPQGFFQGINERVLELIALHSPDFQREADRARNQLARWSARPGEKLAAFLEQYPAKG